MDPMTTTNGPNQVPEIAEIDTMPQGDWCPIGSLNLHTYNFERNECIWCGPNRLAWADGHWVDLGNGTSAWSVANRPGQGQA